MDELSALPPDDLRKTAARIRTTSLGVRQAYPPSPSTTRAESPLRHRNSAGSSSSSLLPGRPEIIAPTPQRHLLESSASQLWLRTPPISPISSRAASPVSPSSRIRDTQHHTTNFSSLLQHYPARPLSTRPKAQQIADAESAAMGRRWVRWLHKRGLKHWVAPAAIIAATLVKTCIGIGSYSGQGTPPMFGDYEAQRHWMELTIHLPIRQWYTYDLQYWGLDYPPLTAYVSWLCGIAGSYVEPSWVALDASRGIESPGSKLFMRSTVMVLDALVYIPALLMFARTWHGNRSKRAQGVALLTLLFQPALLLIDHGHFQYNSVMLGLTLFALNFFATGQDIYGAICFVLSLGFKQMSLYYAPAIGSYLLAKCWYLGPDRGVILFVRLAIVTSFTFFLLFLPFLPPFAPTATILDPITRIFPFARGLFEDKVANFWCASNVFIKWQRWGRPDFVVNLSALLTLAGFLPTVFLLADLANKFRISKKPNTPEAETPTPAKRAPFLALLPYALLNSAMSFFLFSYQVHEKSILLPLMPITLLMSGAHVDSYVFSWGALVNNTAMFSMWPLLKRDGLAVQYVATLLLWNRLIGHNPFRTPKSFVQLLTAAVYISAAALHVLEIFIAPPSRYPDVYPVLNVLICAPVFMCTWLWSWRGGLEVGWALVNPGSGSKTDQIERKPSVGEHTPTEAILTSYRQLGGRTVSLGFGQSKRRKAYGGSSRASSVMGGE